MGIDAITVPLGPARVQHWTVESEAEYLAARHRELVLLEAIEVALARQLGREIRFDPPLVPERQVAPAKELERIDPMPWRIGGSDGLAPLQAAVLSVETGEDFSPSWCADEPQKPRQAAQSRGFTGYLHGFRHLLDHDPQTGLYLPVDFAEPFEVVSDEEVNTVGSLDRLVQESERWQQEIPPRLYSTGISVPEWMLFYAGELNRGARLALEQGLALELG